VTGTYWDSVSGVCKVSTESLEVNLTADPISISQGQSTNLTWSSNGDYCTSDFFSGQRPASGNSLATPPTLPYTYTVECFGLGQQASRSIVILNSYKKQPIYVEPQ
jgi:hypothetical protein